MVHCGLYGTQAKSPPAEGAAKSKTKRKKPEPERSYRVPWAELLQKGIRCTDPISRP